MAAAAASATQPWDRLVAVVPCAGQSEGSPGTRTVVLLGRPPANLLEHELGHTFGMSHAGSLVCLRQRCSLDAYGNPVDAMGSGLGDFGAIQKAQAGWPVNVVSATIPGTYTLGAIETATTLPQALVVHRGNVDLWIEHRAPIANDAYLPSSIWHRWTSGVLVHEAPANDAGIPFSERKPDFLLGTPTPASPTLVARGETFTVPHVLAIDVLRRTATTITIKLRKLR